MRKWKVQLETPTVQFDGIVKAPTVVAATIKAMALSQLDFFNKSHCEIVHMVHVEEWIELEQQELYDNNTETLCFPA